MWRVRKHIGAWSKLSKTTLVLTILLPSSFWCFGIQAFWILILSDTVTLWAGVYARPRKITFVKKLKCCFWLSSGQIHSNTPGDIILSWRRRLLPFQPFHALVCQKILSLTRERNIFQFQQKTSEVILIHFTALWSSLTDAPLHVQNKAKKYMKKLFVTKMLS